MRSKDLWIRMTAFVAHEFVSFSKAACVDCIVPRSGYEISKKSEPWFGCCSMCFKHLDSLQLTIVLKISGPIVATTDCPSKRSIVPVPCLVTSKRSILVSVRIQRARVCCRKLIPTSVTTIICSASSKVSRSRR